MKKHILLLLLLTLLFCISCAPKDADSCIERMKRKGYNIESYTSEKYDMSKYDSLYDIEGTEAVITAFKNDNRGVIGDYCNITLFKTIKDARTALKRFKEIYDKSEIHDDTVYAYKRIGKWVYYGTEQGMKDFINQ